MNTIDIPHISHKVYANTFLEDVAVGFEFHHVTECQLSECRENLNEFFLRFFNYEEAYSKFVSDGGIVLKNNEGVKFVFGQSTCFVQINKTSYSNFVDSAVKHIAKLKWYVFKCLGLNDVRKLRIHKVNLLHMNLTDKKIPTKKELEAFVFSTNFINHEVSNTKEIDGAMFLVENRSLTKEDILINLQNGFSLSPDKDIIRTIFEIDGSSLESLSIREQDFDSLLIRINDFMFDVFHWSINKETILEAMDNN